ncbi:MAG: hypothetical protein ACKOXO_06840 [Cyanobium sp.]
MTPAPDQSPAASPQDAPATPHNFDIQKEEHRRIRNDPDYDDWEYGTEPLPHEAWLARQAAQQPPTPADDAPAA